jgi:hypothetical protein
MYLSSGARRARGVMWLGAVVVWVGLLVVPWWPEGFQHSHFTDFRSEPIKDYERYADDWWDAVPYGYYLWGYFAHLMAAVAMPIMVTRRGWHWVGGGAVLVATVWEFIAVEPYGLVNTTVAPYLPMGAAVVMGLAWLLIRTGGEDDVWKLFRGPAETAS